MKQEKKFKAKTKDLFYIFFSVWCIDFITTVLALNLKVFEGKLTEGNPIANWFFSFGLIGWITAFLFSFSLIFLLCFLGTKLINSLKNEKLKVLSFMLFFSLFVLFEFIAILNNIILMLK